MKYLKSWLQDYIVETLPHDSVISDVLNKKSFEVEEIDATTLDSIFDIKVLPNRAHDALGHMGMARELCGDFGYTFKEDVRVFKNDSYFDSSIASPSVEIDDAKLCTRFMSMRIDGVIVGESPAWLKERLEAIGQRSINNIVDITNYVQFALNKPMHAYDTRSISGTLRTRFAKQGEKLMTLDDKELTLDEQTLVIADDEKVLGLAGIKGGKYSGIQNDTTSIMLESANFSPVLIRKTAQRYGMKTDASKRFENGIANSLVEEGLYMTANLIKEICVNVKAGAVVDVYPKKDTAYNVGISKKELNDILGTDYSDDEIKNTLQQLSFSFETIIPEDYIRETYPKLVGAMYKNPSSMREDAPNAFSCSSLISYLYKGIWMPSISIDKYVFAKKITKDELRFGDLIFVNSNEGKIRFESVEFLRGTKVPEGVDHVGMYLGDGNVIHATKLRGAVVIESVDEFSLSRTIVGYGRIAEDLGEERYVVDVPSERLDVRIKEDLAEEIGRIIGYEKLVPTLPILLKAGIVYKRMYYENKIREILLAKGFSEVITYTFGNEGEVEIVKGLADDKEKLRENISSGLNKSLEINLNNAPLLGEKNIKIFEFGKVFSNNLEENHLAIGCIFPAKKLRDREVMVVLDEVVSQINLALIKYSIFDSNILGVEVKNTLLNGGDELSFGNTREINFDKIILSLKEPTTYEAPTFASLPVVSYKTVSNYPFITRDIAMWVPGGTAWEGVLDLCDEVGVTNPDFPVSRIDLFDTFSKEIDGINKTSYAFRIVFQSYEKTLTDEEVNIMMEPYYELFKSKGFEIR